MSVYFLHALTATTTPVTPVRSARRERMYSRRRRGMLLALASAGLAFASVVLILFSDPYWLALPLAMSAIGLAQFVLYRLDDEHPAALMGNAVGMCAVMLWLIIDLFLRYVVGYDFSLLHLAQWSAN